MEPSKLGAVQKCVLSLCSDQRAPLTTSGQVFKWLQVISHRSTERGNQRLQAQLEVSRSSALDHEELSLNLCRGKGKIKNKNPCLDSRSVIHKVSAFINGFFSPTVESNKP